jgi:intracellular sulfur oxidation DsrE/DsrF family protein
MKLRFLSLVAIAAATMFLAFAPQVQADGYAPQKVVYHVNYPGGEGDKAYKGAMQNIQNHINAVGVDNIEIKVVMHGNGVGLVQNAKNDQGLQTIIGGLKSQKVAFQVCNNTLVGRKISWENDLYDVWEEDIVPSGVAEIAKLQLEGYAYIKP